MAKSGPEFQISTLKCAGKFRYSNVGFRYCMRKGMKGRGERKGRVSTVWRVCERGARFESFASLRNARGGATGRDDRCTGGLPTAFRAVTCYLWRCGGDGPAGSGAAQRCAVLERGRSRRGRGDGLRGGAGAAGGAGVGEGVARHEKTLRARAGRVAPHAYLRWPTRFGRARGTSGPVTLGQVKMT